MSKSRLIQGMSLEERCKLFTGKNLWELEPINNKIIRFSDGPHGLRKEIIMDGRIQTAKAICYPASVLSACSFDKRLLYKLGRSLAKECIKNRVDVLLAPGVNIKRNPLCGRSFEYFSEDPYLSGILASEYIKGCQGENVGVSLKHFAVNNQEEARFVNNSIVDERALREIYLKPFEIAIKNSNPWSVMASYNKVNGVHSTENEHLLNDILRGEFNYQGVVMTDWGAINDPIKSLKAGLDLEMPGLSKGSSERIYNSIKDGSLDIDTLDKSSERLVKLYMKTKKEKKTDFDYNMGLDLCRRINEESIVLLKNNNNILPIKRNEKIALIGSFAKKPRFQGGGSSKINPIYLGNLCDEFLDENLYFSYTNGYDESLKPNMKLIKSACDTAKLADKVIIMCGLPYECESEGYDRLDMKLPESHLALIDEVYKVNKNIIVILQNGSPVEMPFIDKVDGIIESYLGGSMHAKALKNIILGNTNPSGRLAETFPLKYEDSIISDIYLENPYHSLYRESIYVGYRYYDTFNKPVLFPFGYGLSYSDVSYSNLDAKVVDSEIQVSFSIKNNSNLECKEVLELYVGKLNSKVFRVKKELKEFNKTRLMPNEEKDYYMSIPLDSLKFYSPKEKRYILEGGLYRIYLAKNVSDESMYIDINIDGEEVEPFGSDVYYNMDHLPTNDEFYDLLGYTPNLIHKRRPFTIDSPLIDLKASLRGKLIYKPLKHFILKSIDDDDTRRIASLSLDYNPIRSVQIMSKITKSRIDAIVDFLNWHFIRCIKKLIRK